MSVLTLESSHPLALPGAIRTDPAGYAKLVQWYGRASLLKEQPVLLDLATTTWIDANQCALLRAMLYDLGERKGLEFCVDGDLVRQKFSVLLRNGFVYDDSTSWAGGSTTSVQMQAFDITDDAGFIEYITNCLLQQPDMGTSCSATEQGNIVSHLLEVFTNVRRHAETNRPVFVCGQYYPKTRQLVFTLVDLGRGYLGPIRDFTSRPQYQRIGPPIVLAENALRWALLNKNSSLPERRGGLGLKMLRDYCIGRGGELHLVSDGYYLAGRRGADGLPVYTVTAVPPFIGSTVHSVFNCV